MNKAAACLTTVAQYTEMLDGRGSRQHGDGQRVRLPKLIPEAA